jgi:hypothetical protein
MVSHLLELENPLPVLVVTLQQLQNSLLPAKPNLKQTIFVVIFVASFMAPTPNILVSTSPHTGITVNYR